MDEKWRVEVWTDPKEIDLFKHTRYRVARIGNLEKISQITEYGRMAYEVGEIISRGSVAQLTTYGDYSLAITAIGVKLKLTRAGYKGIQTRVKRQEEQAAAYFRLNLD
jgi:hypothetical protein